MESCGPNLCSHFHLGATVAFQLSGLYIFCVLTPLWGFSPYLWLFPPFDSGLCIFIAIINCLGSLTFVGSFRAQLHLTLLLGVVGAFSFGTWRFSCAWTFYSSVANSCVATCFLFAKACVATCFFFLLRMRVLLTGSSSCCECVCC